MRSFLLVSFLLAYISAGAQYVFKEYNINPVGDSKPMELKVVNGKLFFTATTQAEGNELFTTSGVHPNFNVVDIMAGATGSGPANLTALNSSQIVFSADGGSGKGTEVWLSDGTTVGTTLLKDVYAGGVSSTPEHFVSYGGKVYFSAFGSNGAYQEFWVTDGSPVGTQMLKDINPTGGSYPDEYCEMNGKLYFTATTDALGAELWVTDGTDTGTKMVKDVMTGSQGSFPHNKFVINNKLMFQGGYAPPTGSAIYVSDGTTAGTGLFGKTGLNRFNDFFIIPWNNKVYFDGGSLGPGIFWSTDGTTTGTSNITPIGVSGWPAVYNNKLYFAATSAAEGSEIWVSDGTTAGTKVLKDIITGTTGSYPSHLTVYKNKLYFIGETAPGDTGVYVSDGTDTGTHVLLNPSGTNANAFTVNAFHGFVEMNGVLYFGANYSSNGAELWSLEDTTKPVSVANNSKLVDEVKLYPNPATEVCNVVINTSGYTKGSVLLCDMAGRSVQQLQLTSGQKTATLSLKNIPAGVYTIRVDLDGNIVNRKLVVQ